MHVSVVPLFYNLPAQVTRMRTLTVDSQSQHRLLDVLAALVTETVKLATPIMRLQHTKRQGDARKPVASDEGTPLMESLVGERADWYLILKRLCLFSRVCRVKYETSGIKSLTDKSHFCGWRLSLRCPLNIMGGLIWRWAPDGGSV
jgi:hypothetical protein